MGLFSLFRRSKPLEAHANEIPPSQMPTVGTPPQLSAAFDKAFCDAMVTIEGLSQAEKNDIHNIITNCKGGHLNQGGYYHDIYNKYFRNREWSWGEFEKWQLVFDKLGEYPSRWPSKKFSMDDLGIIRMIKVSDIKNVLIGLGVDLPNKAKKDDLINFVLVNHNLKNAVLGCQEAENVREKFSSDKGRDVYALLIQTISGRAHSQSDQQRQADLGIHGMMKRELSTFKEDRKFVDLALAENPNALPPFFPGDISMYISRISFDDNEAT